jgi:hypothetical protein
LTEALPGEFEWVVLNWKLCSLLPRGSWVVPRTLKSFTYGNLLDLLLHHNPDA